MSVPPFSVIIPAHNEQDVIARCLNALLQDVPDDAVPEVIVVANGCSDRTVEIARAVAPRAIVLDLAQGGKAMAMNEGSRLASAMPRFFLDADIQCSYATLAATADSLRMPGVMAASPALRLDVSRCDPWVRAYYRVWTTLPYITDRMVGSGLFGLSEEGMQTLGEFPPIFGDDIWVRTRFSYDQRRNVGTDADGNPAYFTVFPPRTLGDIIKIEARRRIGDDEVREKYPSPHEGRINTAGSLRKALKKNVSIIDMAIYVGIKIMAQVCYRWNKARRKSPVWVRDLNARSTT